MKTFYSFLLFFSTFLGYLLDEISYEAKNTNFIQTKKVFSSKIVTIIIIELKTRVNL
jgi:hypothetical protein